MTEQQQVIEHKDQEIAALRQQIDSLQQQLLFHGIRPRGWRAKHEPSDQEIDRLLAIVQERYKALVPKYDNRPSASSLEDQEKNYKQQFAAALRYLFQARRADDGKLATGYAASYWTDAASQYTRMSIGLLAFCSAAVACGDVSYAKFDSYPYNLAFGLTLGSRSEHVDLSAGWRKVLAGQIIEPTKLDLPTAMVGRPQELIVAGDRASFHPDAWWRR
jgi:hypothetical protein